MSSNIKITRICQFCGAEFTARTTVTKYCSHPCASSAYKQRTRNQNMEKSAAETVKIISVKQTEIQAKEFLTINEASELLNVSRWTISCAIAAERLKTVRMGKRVIIRRKDIDELFT
jgi:excisionase family DNA binding protein